MKNIIFLFTKNNRILKFERSEHGLYLYDTEHPQTRRRIFYEPPQGVELWTSNMDDPQHVYGEETADGAQVPRVGRVDRVDERVGPPHPELSRAEAAQSWR